MKTLPLVGEDGDDDKKRQKRGGKGMVRIKKKEVGPKKVCYALEALMCWVEKRQHNANTHARRHFLKFLRQCYEAHFYFESFEQ